MTLLFLLTFFFVFISGCFAQQPGIEVKMLEYIWARQSDDDRVVFVQDTIYQQQLKRSFIKAVEDKWNIRVPEFEVKINKLPVMRAKPKFNGSVSNADTTNTYIFLQLFDKSIPHYVQSYSAYSAMIDVRYRLIKGSVVQNKSASFNIIKTNPPPGQTRINQYPFHPSGFQNACDTIFGNILNEITKNDNEIWLEAACGFADSIAIPDMNTKEFQFGSNQQSLSVPGLNGFNIVQDSVNIIQTGKKKHVAGNTALGLLTYFSNIDTEKKRSALYTADHSFSEGSDVYHAYMNYIETNVAERRRVKDDEGFKTVEVGEYQSGWKSINPGVMHFLTLNGDTVTSFNIQFHLKKEQFIRMWNGRDTSTIYSLPPAFNNPAMTEMEMKGNIDNNRFILFTSDEGRIKKLKFNDDEVFACYSNSSPEGVLSFRKLNERQLRIATVLCLLANKYYQYK